MRRTRVMVALAIIVLGLVGLAYHAHAELAPVPVVPRNCYVPEHDMNGDGRVNEADFNLWKDWLFQSGETCYRGAPAEGCPPRMDIDGNGYITFDDLNIMLARYRDCVMAPRAHTDPQG
jgi:hypothetical protein